MWGSSVEVRDDAQPLATCLASSVPRVRGEGGVVVRWQVARQGCAATHPARVEADDVVVLANTRWERLQPGEEIAIAYVIAHQTADGDGSTALHLPPALLAAKREGLVLLGMTSHVIASID